MLPGAPSSANERSLIRHDGAHGVPRPAILDWPFVTGKWYKAGQGRALMDVRRAEVGAGKACSLGMRRGGKPALSPAPADAGSGKFWVIGYKMAPGRYGREGAMCAGLRWFW